MAASNLFIRTEEIEPDQILSYLVRTTSDHEIIEHLKSRAPILLNGSRGSGKSFLLRAAQAELIARLPSDRVLPVYAKFMSSPLIRVGADGQFLPWMVATIASEIIRAAQNCGITIPRTAALAAIGGDAAPTVQSRMEAIRSEFENSWRNPMSSKASEDVPELDLLIDATRDLCKGAGLHRVNLLIDEAAHVFLPEQQRQFFGLMRDLRSPHIAVKAAVYPGATSYGAMFQPQHDATIVSVDRDISDPKYIASMREMVCKQGDEWVKVIQRHGEVFDTLAYAATGNPRILVTTMTASMPLNHANADRVIRTYYRQAIWKELNDLASRYPGHRHIIDWATDFMRNDVLADLKRRHYRTPTTVYDLWIHRDAPHFVKEALQLLCYCGVLQEGAQAVKGKNRAGVGNRFFVNLGCQFAEADNPSKYALDARSGLKNRDTIDYGRNHLAYETLMSSQAGTTALNGNTVLEARLQAPSDELELTSFQRAKLKVLGLKTVGEVLAASEDTFRKARGVGEIRARQLHNAAQAAVLEYLSG